MVCTIVYAYISIQVQKQSTYEEIFCICDNSSRTTHHSQFITASILHSSLGPFMDRSVNGLYSHHVTISKIVVWSFVYALHSRRFFSLYLQITLFYCFTYELRKQINYISFIIQLWNNEKIHKSMLWKI